MVELSDTVLSINKKKNRVLLMQQTNNSVSMAVKDICHMLRDNLPSVVKAAVERNN